MCNPHGTGRSECQRQELGRLHGYVRSVVSQKDPERAARYGIMLYLALISAFKAQGMIELGWAPALTLQVQSVDYEVS